MALFGLLPDVVLVNAKIDRINTSDRYEFIEVAVEGVTVAARFRRNASGLRGVLLGALGWQQLLMLDEAACFDLAEQFRHVSPRLVAHADNALTFAHGGAAVQAKKLELKRPLERHGAVGV